MLRGTTSCLLVIWFLLSATLGARSQSDAPLSIPGRVGPVLRIPHPVPLPEEPITHQLRFPMRSVPSPSFPQFARAAGMIFSGTVINIEKRPTNTGQAVETVAITIHVENGIRGVMPGQNLTISQWIGLWTSGQRYHLGERVLLFLYPESKLGLTSRVGGALGRFAIDSRGRVLLTAQHLSTFRTDPVLGGRSRVSLSDLALAVRRASEEE